MPVSKVGRRPLLVGLCLALLGCTNPRNGISMLFQPQSKDYFEGPLMQAGQAIERGDAAALQALQRRVHLSGLQILFNMVAHVHSNVAPIEEVILG